MHLCQTAMQRLSTALLRILMNSCCRHRLYGEGPLYACMTAAVRPLQDRGSVQLHRHHRHSHITSWAFRPARPCFSCVQLSLYPKQQLPVPLSACAPCTARSVADCLQVSLAATSCACKCLQVGLNTSCACGFMTPLYNNDVKSSIAVSMPVLCSSTAFFSVLTAS